MNTERRGLGFWVLAAFFALFVLFLYGPLTTIFILSFQGPDGGLTFPMNGVSLRWFRNLFETQAVGDFGGSFLRSLVLGLMVMATTIVVVAPRGNGVPPSILGSGTAVLYGDREPDRAVDPRQPRHRPSVPGRRHPIGLVLVGLRGASDLGIAVRLADHVRGLQPLQSEL